MIVLMLANRIYCTTWKQRDENRELVSEMVSKFWCVCVMLKLFNFTKAVNCLSWLCQTEDFFGLTSAWIFGARLAQGLTRIMDVQPVLPKDSERSHEIAQTLLESVLSLQRPFEVLWFFLWNVHENSELDWRLNGTTVLQPKSGSLVFSLLPAGYDLKQYSISSVLHRLLSWLDPHWFVNLYLMLLAQWPNVSAG